jgi:hypothetical protein
MWLIIFTFMNGLLPPPPLYRHHLRMKGEAVQVIMPTITPKNQQESIEEAPHKRLNSNHPEEFFIT